MKGECLSYHINTKLKPNDHPLTNYSHFNDPTPQMLLRTNIVLTCSIGHNWEPSLILKNFHCRVRYFHQFLIFPTLRNNYFEVNMVKLSIRGAGLWKCLISAFRHFLQPLFQNDQGWPIIPNFSLLTWYMVINRYVRLQNCFLWHVWRSIFLWT